MDDQPMMARKRQLSSDQDSNLNVKSLKSASSFDSQESIDDANVIPPSQESLKSLNSINQSHCSLQSLVMQSQQSVEGASSARSNSQQSDGNERGMFRGDELGEDVGSQGSVNAVSESSRDGHERHIVDAPLEDVRHERGRQIEEYLDDFEELEADDLEVVGDEGGNDEPVYPGAKISVAESLTAILTYVVTHNLTNVAISHLLSLISLHCITTNEHIRSFYKFRKFFSHLQTSIKRHYYCSVCFAMLDSKSDVCAQCRQSKCDFFLSMSIIEQLETLMKRKGFVSKLNYRNERVKKFPENYEDIYDGNLYKEKVQEGFLKDHNLSFTWNSDGLSLFQSSKYSVWPFYLVVNELQYSERFKEENMILAGLWLGPSKPCPNIFLRAFRDELQTLYETGVSCKIPEDPANPLQVKAVVLCGSCDLPATATYLEMIFFNGYYPCHKCLIKGERDGEGDEENTFPKIVYPGGELCQLRNDENTRECANLALVRGEPVNGIKGPCYISQFVPNCFRATAIDVMHCGYSGVAKKKLNLWFGKEYNGLNFSLRAHIDLASAYICKITPPEYVQRAPRSIVDHLSYWKASEFEVWEYYYSIPVLNEMMSPEYLNHHMCGVYGLYLLNKDSVSEVDIQKATALLKEFVSQFPILYSRSYMSLNVHLLLHMPNGAREFGPGFTTSLFPFENFNLKLSRLVRGTTHAELQICTRLSYLTQLPNLIDSLDENSEAKKFCKMVTSKEKIAVAEVIEDGVDAVGKITRNQDIPPLVLGALIESNIRGNFWWFPSLRKGRIVYRSQRASRSTRTASHSVTCVMEGNKIFGKIVDFVKVTDCECELLCEFAAKYFVIISVYENDEPFQIRYPRVTVDYIHRCKEPGIILALPLSALKAVCFVVTVKDVLYIVEPVNRVEVE